MIIRKEAENKCFHVLVRGIVIDEGYLLAVKGKGQPYTFLVGGHLEFNENLQQALQREIQEELGYYAALVAM
ncbi:MAG: DUF4916 domain-containing protein [Spirochaetaceae bacterium]|nr:DUF4916 domain-containing protein [Spirochaetaceae bacterium]